jgi:predicted HicB family RNase H-like nuclease
MQYKGYLAAIEYDESVELFHGRVVNAGDYPVATFEASDVAGLKREFRISVEDYLAFCKEKGLEPAKPYSGTVSIRLGSTFHRRATLRSMEDGMSLSDWVKKAIEEKISGKAAKHP